MTQFIKKCTLLIVIAALLSGHSFAQLGIQVGWNTTNYSLKNNGVKDKRSLIWGVNAGAMYRIGIIKKLAVQPELLFSQKGAVNNNLGSSYTSGVSRWVNKLNYVELGVPVLFRMKLLTKSTFDMGAGPYIATLVSAKSRIEYLNGDKKKDEFKIGSDATDDFKRMDMGYKLYMGAKLSHVNFSMCYARSISDISPTATQTVKNGCFSLNFGVFF